MIYNVLVHIAADGSSAFSKWFDDLDEQAAAKVTMAVERMRAGNLSNAKSVGEGVLEYRINWAAGYRIYFGRDGDRLIILLTGGTKQRQQNDITRAKAFWQDYKRRRI